MDDLSDLSKLKVAELKKELKNRGLPVTGNKTELIERLEVAISTGGISVDASLGEEDFDEEEILGDDTDDIPKLTPQEEEAALQGTLKIKNANTLMETEKKKISLKRPENVPVVPEVEATQETSGDKVPESTSEEKESESRSAGEEPDKKKIKLSATNENTAEMFGTDMSDEAKKAARAARFNITAPTGSTLPQVNGTDTEKLRARAERFGEVTAKALTKVELDEKLKKRQERFGASTPSTKTSVAPSESSESNNTETNASSTEITAGSTEITADSTETTASKGGLVGAAASVLAEDELKRKRAERFGTK